MIYVIGSNGFVGSAVCSYLEKMGKKYVGVTRSNYRKYVGNEMDCLINCNGNGFRSKANQDPKSDFGKNVESTVNLIFDFGFKKFIHVSSVEVYPDKSHWDMTAEDHTLDPYKLDAYGFHKYLSEEIVEYYCPNYLILRLGGMVGKNLKKNAIYDWTHNKPFLVSEESRLNYIHTKTVAEIIYKLTISESIKNEIFNVCASESIYLTDLSCVSNFPIREQASGNLETQTYNLNCIKLEKLFPALETSREYIKKYLKEDL